MKFSNTLAILFIELGAASPLMVRDPQGSFPPALQDVSPPTLLPSQDDFDPGHAQPAPSRQDDQGSFPPTLLPSQDDDLDPGFAKQVPPSRGPKNSQGFTQENCDNIRKNFNDEFAAQFGC